MRLMWRIAAASVAPVGPGDTSASARPSPTARAAWTIEASSLTRTALAGSSSLPMPGIGGPKISTSSPESCAPRATTSGPRSAPFASSAITLAGYSPGSAASGATISRPAYVWQFGHTRCGSRGAPQFGQALCVGAEILCVERRLFVRLWDCFCLGTAIGSGQCSRGNQHVLAPVMPYGIEEPLRVQPHAQVAVRHDHALLAVEGAGDDAALVRLDDRSAAVPEYFLVRQLGREVARERRARDVLRHRDDERARLDGDVAHARQPALRVVGGRRDPDLRAVPVERVARERHPVL